MYPSNKLDESIFRTTMKASWARQGKNHVNKLRINKPIEYAATLSPVDIQHKLITEDEKMVAMLSHLDDDTSSLRISQLHAQTNDLVENFQVLKRMNRLSEHSRTKADVRVGLTNEGNCVTNQDLEVILKQRIQRKYHRTFE